MKCKFIFSVFFLFAAGLSALPLSTSVYAEAKQMAQNDGSTVIITDSRPSSQTQTVFIPMANKIDETTLNASGASITATTPAGEKAIITVAIAGKDGDPVMGAAQLFAKRVTNPNAQLLKGSSYADSKTSVMQSGAIVGQTDGNVITLLGRRGTSPADFGVALDTIKLNPAKFEGPELREFSPHFPWEPPFNPDDPGTPYSPWEPPFNPDKPYDPVTPSDPIFIEGVR